MNVEVTLTPGAEVPFYASEGAAGADMKCVSITKIKGGLIPLYEYDTGVAMKIPKGFFAMLCARSSVSKLLMWLANGVGIVDSDYRGTIRFRFRSIFGLGKYAIGDRVGQAILLRKNTFEFKVMDTLEESSRGEGGFGSTGE